MANMKFPKMIPQSDGPSVPWYLFLDEAARGSSRAVEIFTLAEYGLVAELTGKRHHAESVGYIYNEQLLGLLLRQPPFSTFEECWQQIEQAGYLPHPLVFTVEPCHLDEFYDNLWQRGEQVDRAELLHDALLQCYDQWTVRAYWDVRERIEEFTDEDSYSDYYNAQDAVAAMLFLVGILAASSPDR